MNILITGVHGFVGTNLTKALSQSHTIYGLDIITPLEGGIVHTYKWDELSQLPNVDVVIHLAGMAHDTKDQVNTRTYFEINTGLTQKIYDWFLKSSAKKFIFFSSVKAAADKVVTESLFEDVIPHPVGPYAESKLAAENYILQNQVRPDQWFIILRPCMIHGNGNKGNLNLLFNVIKKGIPYPLGAYDNLRSFTSIDNLVFVISNVVSMNIESGIYNMSDDDPISTVELIKLISETLHKPKRIWRWNKSLIELIAKIGSCLHLPLNSERLSKLTENYVVSNTKIKEALNIDKMPLSAKDGIKQTLQSFSVL